MKARCLAIASIVTILLLSGCFKLKQEACIQSSSTWFAHDSIAVNDSVNFMLCNWLAPSSTPCYWDFGDGYTASGTSVGHKYSSAGRFVVRLSVSTTSSINIDTMLMTVISTSGPDYAGTFNATRTCMLDTSGNGNGSYVVTIAANSLNSVTLHNLFNDGADVDATVDSRKITTTGNPSADGTISLDHSYINLWLGSTDTVGKDVVDLKPN